MVLLLVLLVLLLLLVSIHVLVPPLYPRVPPSFCLAAAVFLVALWQKIQQMAYTLARCCMGSAKG